MNKQIRNTFNDGFVTYGHEETIRSDRGKRIGATFNQVGRLAYQEMYCRESDYEMASFMSAVLDIKIKTPYPPSFRGIKKSGLKVVREGIEFDVIKADVDRDSDCIYFYLQEVGAFEQDKTLHETTD